MLRIIQQDIIPEESELLYQTNFANGELAVECVDPDPLPYGKIGFGVYASKAQFRNLKVYRPLVKDFRTTYQELHMAKGK